MIRLEITEGESRTSYLFNQVVITVGFGSEEECDLPLKNDSLSSPHVKLVAEGDGYLVINVANDPYVTLNQLPFGKRTLKTGDRITIHDAEITVSEIGASLIEEEEVNEPEPPLPSPPQEEKPTVRKEEPAPLPETRPQQKMKAKKNPPKKKPLYLYYALAILVFSLSITALLFFGTEEVNEEDEKIAARSVADAAAAFIYSDLNHLPPPASIFGPQSAYFEEISSNLLPSGARSYCFANQKGELYTCPYRLRVYYDSQNRYLLVIAVPRWNWYRWFSPKDSIVLDSTSFELRKVADVQPFNRILHTAGRFDASLQKQLQPLIYQGELITLNEIDEDKGQFAPPPELSKKYAGAEHFIYNAPRYKGLSHAVSQLSKSSSQKTIQDTLSSYQRYPRMIIYTDGTQKEAENTLAFLEENGLKAPILLAFPSEKTGYSLFEETASTSQITQSQDRPNKDKRDEELAKISDEIHRLLLQNIDEPVDNLRRKILYNFRKYEVIDQNRQNRKISEKKSLSRKTGLNIKPIIK